MTDQTGSPRTEALIAAKRDGFIEWLEATGTETEPESEELWAERLLRHLRNHGYTLAPVESEAQSLSGEREGIDAHPKCPAGCGCRLWTEDADRADCGCDGPCCWMDWDQYIADVIDRPDYYREIMVASGRLAAPPCSACGGRRWTNDENWSPDYPESWDGTRTPHDGLIPCGFCNLGGWDVPLAASLPTEGGERTP